MFKTLQKIPCMLSKMEGEQRGEELQEHTSLLRLAFINMKSTPIVCIYSYLTLRDQPSNIIVCLSPSLINLIVRNDISKRPCRSPRQSIETLYVSFTNTLNMNNHW